MELKEALEIREKYEEKYGANLSPFDYLSQGEEEVAQFVKDGDFKKVGLKWDTEKETGVPTTSTLIYIDG